MGLKELSIKDEYRSDYCNLIHDFYTPCLEKATLYNRAVGYFSSTSMIAISRGLTALIKTGGKMRLVASPYLSQEDTDAITQGLRKREEVISSSVRQELDQEFEQVARDQLGCLAWLLSQGILEIKLAVAKNIHKHSIYHEKVGIFSDAVNDVVAFTGSANESSAALIDNFECLDVFCSWKANERERVLRKAENFERLWNNNTSQVEVVSFPEAAARSLLRLRPDRAPTQEPETKQPTKYGTLAESGGIYRVSSNETNQPEPEKSNSDQLQNFLKVELKPRQLEALNAWKAANCHGILAMATGTGKTVTGLACAAGVENLDFLVISVPTNEIVQQWVEEIRKITNFPLPLEATGKAEEWMEKLFRKLGMIHRGELPRERLPVVVVGSYGELSKSRVADLFADAGGFPKQSLIIADEVHAAGASTYRRILREDFQYRLGLSATPVRPHDEEGTEVVLEYFSGIVYEFTLEEAIEAGILCEYEYHVHVTTLADNEYEKFKRLTNKIGCLLNRDEEDAQAQEERKHSAIQRADIIKSAAAKFPALDRILDQHPPRRGMIYCADIGQATDVCGKLTQHGFRVARYCSKDVDRQSLLSEFFRGNLDALVSVKCLDEGVDIPAADLAIILASDTSPRQFIQRRGRVLRAAPKKAIAKLVDIIVVPPLGDYPAELIDSEIKRVIQFASSARNRTSVITKLVRELAPYGISHSDLME